MRDTTIAGYNIPEDTMIMINIDYLMRNDCSGNMCIRKNASRKDFCLRMEKLSKRPKEFIPFGVGKRFCLGETLARRTLAVFFINILQNFHFSTPDCIDVQDKAYPDSDKASIGLTRVCNDFFVKITQL